MTHDTGLAPCVESKKLSLACCKATMRKSISNEIYSGSYSDVLILGLCGKMLCRNEAYKAIYTAVINKNNIMTVDDYYKLKDIRKDNNHIGQKDEYVFFKDEFCYWGNQPVDIRQLFDPAMMYFNKTARGHRKILEPSDADRYFEWYANQEKFLGVPFTPLDICSIDIKCSCT